MSVRDPLTEQVERRLVRWIELGLGKTWVVAVSGGSDSVGMLRVLHQLAGPLRLSLSVAHLDHGVRGDEARADAAFVDALANSLGLPFVLGCWQPTRAGHFESDARRARYDWLTEVARQRGASVIAAGHTSDDQAETILHRVIRGTGPRGLAGIPERRELSSTPRLTLVRPLLRVSRQEVRSFLAAMQQPYREDASNADMSRTRARIRHDLLPKLAAEYNPQVGRALLRLGSLASASARAIETHLREIERSAVITQSPDTIVLKHGVLREVPLYQRAEILRRLWRKAGWPQAGMSESRWRRLAVLVENDEVPRIDVGARVEVSIEQFFLVLRRRVAASSSSRAPHVLEPVPLTVPGLTAVPWAAGAIDAQLESGLDRVMDETIDLDAISLPMLARVAVAGDRFEPLGMGGQSMPLADFFRGRHLDRRERTRVPLVCDQGGIIWVVGHRIADRVKVSENTRRNLRLSWNSQDKPGAGKV
jgi:tRNA(Ile)-lysidine synthase